jgi:hypothetical protein
MPPIAAPQLSPSNFANTKIIYGHQQNDFGANVTVPGPFTLRRKHRVPTPLLTRAIALLSLLWRFVVYISAYGCYVQHRSVQTHFSTHALAEPQTGLVRSTLLNSQFFLLPR